MVDSAKRSPRKSRRPSLVRRVVAVTRETARVAGAWVRHGALGLPVAMVRSVLQDPQLDSVLSRARLGEVLGQQLLQFFDSVGPVYGKAAQVALSRVPGPTLEHLKGIHADRLFGQWPPLLWHDVADILDRAIPQWRTHLTVEATPLGVASIAQVHGAVDGEGREWVVKIVKPQARERLGETLEAMDAVVSSLETVAVTKLQKRILREWRDMAVLMRGEIDLRKEAETLERLQGLMSPRGKEAGRSRLVKLPKLWQGGVARDVIVLERFRGVSLADVASGRHQLAPEQKKRLARRMLKELLVQIFEVGLFHADPHAGNLILCEDGSMGLFDWGLTGELTPVDRQTIAAVLRAVISLDLERLVDAVHAMGVTQGHDVARESVAKELHRLAKQRESEKDIQKLMNNALESAERLGIPVPTGLLMMAKALMTIEGLARGLDPEASLGRIAGPVLWKAARPAFADMARMAMKAPVFFKRMFSSGLLALCVASGASDARANVVGPGQGTPDTVAFIGDSLSTGAATHPALQFDTERLYAVARGEVPVMRDPNHIPADPDFSLREPILAPTRLWPSRREYDGAFEWVAKHLWQGVSRRYLDTPEYSWAYHVATRMGFAPERILIAAENGAKAWQARWQVARVLDATGGTIPRKVFIFFSGNDLCAPNVPLVTTAEVYEHGLATALRLLAELGRPGPAGADVYVVSHLSDAQLLHVPSILGKSVYAMGKEASCREHRTTRGNFTMADLCPSMFRAQMRMSEEEQISFFAGRVREFRDAAERALTTVREEFKDVSGLRWHSLKGSAGLDWEGPDIAGDCFHLSPVGHMKLAHAVWRDLAALPQN